MATLDGGLIDLKKPGKYPIVFSDELLGKSSSDVYTGVRYNHRPEPSNSSAASLRLQPADDPTSYDLSVNDGSDKYEYAGSRATGDGQFVLIFDPVKKNFVIHRVDSTFDMNLVSAPWAQDAESLRAQYPQLEPQARPEPQPSQPPQRKPSKGKGSVTTKASTTKAAAVRATTSKAAATTKATAKTTPAKKQKAEKPKKKAVREPTPEPEEDDSDDGLTVEYPDGPSSYKYQPASKAITNIHEPSDDEDAEGEDDYDVVMNQDVDYLQLPPPANNDSSGFSDADLERDLEAELERAMDETAENNEQESDESEEE